jgi:hypothetical protein
MSAAQFQGGSFNPVFASQLAPVEPDAVPDQEVLEVARVYRASFAWQKRTEIVQYSSQV